MKRIAFFGHDAADAAIRRRVQGFHDDGLDVTGFMMRRNDNVDVGWENVDLGRTFDAAYGQRITAIIAGARRAAAERDKLARADVIYARNLDMLATAFLAKHLTGLKTPVVYEALDVHRLLTRNDLIGLALRRIEGALLTRTQRLVVSSPAFLDRHFEIHHKGRYRPSLVENRLAAGATSGPRPSRVVAASGKPLRLGWVGVLRCARSLDLLLEVARSMGPDVRIVMHGTPALTEIPDFHAKLRDVPNIEFHGPYRAPEDLARIYSGLDLVWAGDFMEAGFNSEWLLPNRLYEGGYHAVPAIAPAGTETAKWILERGVGFAVHGDLQQNLPALIKALIDDRAAIVTCRVRLLDLPQDVFVQQRGELTVLIENTLRDSAWPAKLNLNQSTQLTPRNSLVPKRP